MYSEEAMDHFMHPRNMGVLEDPSGSAAVEGAKCGDIMQIQIKVEKGIITEIRFKTDGCAAAIAIGSRMTEMVKGKTIDEALGLTVRQIADDLGSLPPSKTHCSEMIQEALHGAIDDHRRRRKAGEIRENCLPAEGGNT